MQPLPTKLFSASYNCTLVDGSKLPVAFYSILCLAGTRKRLGRTCVTEQISMRIGWFNHYHYELISYHDYVDVAGDVFSISHRHLHTASNELKEELPFVTFRILNLNLVKAIKFIYFLWNKLTFLQENIRDK